MYIYIYIYVDTQLAQRDPAPPLPGADSFGLVCFAFKQRTYTRK